MLNPHGQYATDDKLAARQRFWAVSRRVPAFELYPWVLDLAGTPADLDAEVLDIGCGNGRYERLLVASGHKGRVVGLDLSAGMVAEAARVAPGAAFVRGDAQVLPLAPASFDVALAPHMLYHVPDVGAAAVECRRVLRDGGVFVAVTNGTANLAGLHELVERAVGTGWRMQNPAEHFNLENGASSLGGAFATVECVRCPPSEVVVSDLDALAAYIDSIGDHYEASVGLPWAEVVRRAVALARAEMDAGDGALHWETVVGAFVCR